jgi:hypothetical protein
VIKPARLHDGKALASSPAGMTVVLLPDDSSMTRNGQER